MRRITIPLVLIALAGACAPAPVSSPAPTPADYAAALADPIRPATDRARDEARKPAELLAFAQIAPGEEVGDYVMGGGYLTRILAAAVGPKGRVHAFQPQEFIAFRAAYGDEQRQTVAAAANIVAVNGSISAPAFSAPLDTIITVQNFHDLYLKPFPEGTGAKASSALFRSLKPGGTLVVVDHSAVAGSGTSAADTLHRIELRAVVDALTQAGFKLEAESALFARPDDPRTANVFDPAIRGNTDQFVLRFRKPG
jgi:predicted methyltransferase